MTMDIDGGNEPLLAKKQVSEPNEAENIKGRDGNSSVQHEASISTTSVFFGLVWQGMDFDRLDDQIRRDVADAAVAQQECNNDKIVQREERVSFLDMSIAFFSRLLFGGYLFALLGVVSDVMVFYDDYSQSNFCQVLLDLSILMYGMHASYCRQRKHLAILASVELLLAILGGNASNIEDIHFCLAIANMFLIGVMSKVVTKRLAGLSNCSDRVLDQWFHFFLAGACIFALFELTGIGDSYSYSERSGDSYSYSERAWSEQSYAVEYV